MNQALYGPIGGILVVVVGWALQQWTKRVEREAQQKKDAEAKVAQDKKDADAREASRVDIADRVSEVWDRTSSRLDRDLQQLGEKCTRCEKALRLVRVDFSSFTDVMEDVMEGLLPLVPNGSEAQRKARVAIAAARLSHMTHNA